jgi:signal transduction histidine kinase
VGVDSRHLFMAFMPPLVAAVLLLWLTQAPLAWSMARRLRTGQREREGLLRGTIEAAERERRRIAGDLHDGVVQDLAATAMSLAAARTRVRTAPPEQTGQFLEEGVETIRGAMRDLRELIVEISPPGLAEGGLVTALRDLLDPLAAAGVRTHLEAAPDPRLDADTQRLLHRCAQEALRNVARHADAHEVRVVVANADGLVWLSVEDDGRGMDERDRALARSEGHVGLDLLEALVADAGGHLEVRSRPDEGTTLSVEVPEA